MPGSIRPAAVAGSWYPASADLLKREVDHYLALADAQPPPPVTGLRALVVPHAGLKYSGPVAAHAYRLVRDHPIQTVILVGPSHFVGFDGVAIWRAGGFDTPLGVAAIDEECASAILGASSIVQERQGPHTREHALEMQLPFLRRVAPEAKIVPLLMGSQTRATARELGDALARVLPSRGALLVASTDLSHYHDALEAARLDAIVIDHVERLDVDGLQDTLDRRADHACGGGAAVAVMSAARQLGATRGAILKYGDSGDVSGDKSAVVGYLAAALGTSPSPHHPIHPILPMISEGDRRALLQIARDALAGAVGGVASRRAVPPGLAGRRAGAFVTLRKNGELRGCIGRVRADQEIAKVVRECAVAASRSDPRFPPVTVSEFLAIDIEISILGPAEPLTDMGDLEIGRHGLLVEADGRRGLLLPQVAAERNWSREIFLTETCIKAGLAGDAWRVGARLRFFEAEVFGEGEEVRMG